MCRFIGMFNPTRTTILSESIATLITDNDIIKIKQYFTSDNINNPLRSLGGYNALQYTSLFHNKNNILKVLIDLGADPFIKYKGLELSEIAHHSNLSCIFLLLSESKNVQIIRLVEEKKSLTFTNNKLTDDLNHKKSSYNLLSDALDHSNDKNRLMVIERKDLVNKLTIEVNSRSHEHILLTNQIKDNKLLKNNNDALLLVIRNEKGKTDDVARERDNFKRKYEDSNKVNDMLIKKQKR